MFFFEKNRLHHLYMTLTLGLAGTVQKAILQSSQTQYTVTAKAISKMLVHTRKDTEMESITLLLCKALLHPQREYLVPAPQGQAAIRQRLET